VVNCFFQVYHTAAINLSLGDGVKYTAPCSNKGTNPYVTPVKNAKAAGIVTVAASGNEQFTDGISSPACTPGVVSVGAVCDANVGSITRPDAAAVGDGGDGVAYAGRVGLRATQARNKPWLTAAFRVEKRTYDHGIKHPAPP